MNEERQIREQYAEFEILSVVLMKIPALWDVVYYLCLQGSPSKCSTLNMEALCFIYVLFTIRI
jgi:hypothetical protein